MTKRATIAAMELAFLLSGRACLTFLAAYGPVAVTMMLPWNRSSHGFLAGLGQVAV
jgi:hypothetical protein